jgi:hypothetical protein
MDHVWNRVSSARTTAPSARALRSLGFFLALSVPAAAQAPRLVVSTTDDVPAAVGLPFSIGDGDLVVVDETRPPDPFFSGGHFQATTGFIPGDVDAFAHLPGSVPGRAEALVFSLLSNEGGYLDGDLFVLTHGGGSALMISEADLANALGAPGSNIDVDALAYDDQGRVLFSLSDNLAASALGALLDGDILRLEPGFASVTLLFTEADVQARVSQATGLADAITDVQALEWGNGELWCAVQSPSRHDGSVIALVGAPHVVFDENAMGLGGAEIDALGSLRPGDERPVFHLSHELAVPGELLHVEARGQPGAPLLVLMAGKSGFVPFTGFGGFGGWYLDRFDPWLNVLTSTRSFPVAFLDGAGRFSADWRLPAGTEFGIGPAFELGWSFQCVDVSGMQLSAPFRVQKL